MRAQTKRRRLLNKPLCAELEPSSRRTSHELTHDIYWCVCAGKRALLLPAYITHIIHSTSHTSTSNTSHANGKKTHFGRLWFGLITVAALALFIEITTTTTKSASGKITQPTARIHTHMQTNHPPPRRWKITHTSANTRRANTIIKSSTATQTEQSRTTTTTTRPNVSLSVLRRDVASACNDDNDGDATRGMLSHYYRYAENADELPHTRFFRLRTVVVAVVVLLLPDECGAAVVVWSRVCVARMCYAFLFSLERGGARVIALGCVCVCVCAYYYYYDSGSSGGRL